MKVGVPPGDNQTRSFCDQCGFVHYQNPQVLVACLATLQSKLMWIRRDTEPRRGFWAIPAGFMEEGERAEAAAARELYEETGGRVDANRLRLYAVGSLPEISEVYLVVRGELLESDVRPTSEAMEIGFFDAQDAPWTKQAYPQIDEVLRQFYLDHSNQRYGVYQGTYAGGEHRFRAVADASTG